MAESKLGLLSGVSAAVAGLLALVKRGMARTEREGRAASAAMHELMGVLQAEVRELRAEMGVLRLENTRLWEELLKTREELLRTRIQLSHSDAVMTGLRGAPMCPKCGTTEVRGGTQDVSGGDRGTAEGPGGEGDERGAVRGG